MKVKDKIMNLRKTMEEKGIDAYIIPTSDPHQSEYIADHYMTRVWISGFTGSAGTVVVTQDRAILWTDGRYFIQAEKELEGSGIELFKMRTPGYPTYSEWLLESLDEGKTVGFNGKVFSQKNYKELEKILTEKNIKFVDEYDLVGEIWTNRPEEPMSKAFVHDVKYTGKTTKEKLEDLRKDMGDKKVNYTLIGSLDDIAWLYNIRGRDVKSNPVLISYTLVSLDRALLFINKEKIDDKVDRHLHDNGVEAYDYNEVIDFLGELNPQDRVFLDPSRINRWLYKSIPEEATIKTGTDLTTVLKGIKNESEIENQKNAYLKDCLALVNFFHWLDTSLGKIQVSELMCAEKVTEFRQEQDDYIETSFTPISAYGANAAMMHYSPSEESQAILEEKGFYLLDSGGQYLDGTTDITRTVTCGPITDEEKKDFTLTLKAHINLLNARFLHGATGYNLDALCRYPLWQHGLDYKCGTGHGVGFLLNVHEGPHGFANSPNNVVPLEEGMVVTVEPGVYKVGKHGIRLENVAVVVKDIETESGQFMRFENMSFCPIDLKAIDKDLLSKEEIDWLNEYHKETYDKLSPYLKDEVKEWLKENTKEI